MKEFLFGVIIGFLLAWLIAIFFASREMKKNKEFANKFLEKINEAMSPKVIGEKEVEEIERELSNENDDVSK